MLHESSHARRISGIALEILGGDSLVLESDCAVAEMADLESGDLWFQSGNLVELSLIEARILAVKWGGAAADDARLSPEASARLLSVLRMELARIFVDVHGKGGTDERGWYRKMFPEAFDRSMARMERSVSRVETEVLRSSLLGLLAV